MNLSDVLTIGAAVLALAFRAQAKTSDAAPVGGGGGGGGGSGGGENPKGPLDDLKPTLISGPVTIFGEDFVGPTTQFERAPGKHWEYILLKSRP